MAAAKGHVAPTSETQERFGIAAAKVNATRRMSSSVVWKAVLDQYKRLHSTLEKHEAVENRMSGVGSEMNEEEEFHANM